MQHLGSLETYSVGEQEELRSLAEKTQGLTMRSNGNKECTLDVLFTAAEVEHALSRLKNKVVGPEWLVEGRAIAGGLG